MDLEIYWSQEERPVDTQQFLKLKQTCWETQPYSGVLLSFISTSLDFVPADFSATSYLTLYDTAPI